MSNACKILHEWANNLPRFTHGYLTDDLPKNGIYLVFEKGETSHQVDRIVRVGTHTGQNNLGKRIFEHLYKPNKDRSIFRKHIGRCLLAKDSFLKQWNLDLTTKANRQKYENIVDFEKQKEIEEKVTKYITNNLSFAVFEVNSKEERLRIEGELLSTITACEKCQPSKNWLGLKHQNSTIRQGLWNVQGLDKDILSKDEMMLLTKKYS